MNWIAVAEVAFEAGQIEDVGQLTQDGMLLDQIFEIVKTSPAKLTKDQVKTGIPAAARTFAVLNKMVGTEQYLDNIMTVLAGV